jgi:1-acyl-sn-glycerol-3-phosphate acyltransferase
VPPRDDSASALPPLSADEQRTLARQRRVGRILAPLWVPLAEAVMRFGMGWRIENARELRERYARLRRESRAPLLVCANHLTMVDSVVVAWALGTSGFYLRDYASLPWNTPEARNFAATWWSRALVYVMKCLPILRGADRKDAALVLARVAHVMRAGDVALVFPEGGRSRTGRVDTEAAAYGVGRLVKAVPGCSVLCLYLRGRGQDTYSDFPKRGERFRGDLALLEPKSDAGGLRGSLEIARQIVGKLAEMEHAFLAR